MRNSEKSVARLLLQSKAIKLNTAKPFTWASGLKSPIYCDNRITLSYPEIRSALRDAFVDLIRKKYPEAEVIAGVATGAIAQGVLVADALGLPFVYVRTAPKGHGLENLIEGELQSGQKLVVVEDLVSTGGSSLKTVKAIRGAGGQVMGMAAIFTYRFPIATESFMEAGCNLDTLSHYHALIEAALEGNYIVQHELDVLHQWHEDPAGWDQ